MNGYDVGCDGSLNRSQHAHDRWVARFIEVCTTTGVSGSFLRSLFTGRAHSEPRPAGRTARAVLRKGSGTGAASGRSLEPVHSCPRVTRARMPLHRKVNAVSTPRRQRLAERFEKGSSSPRGEEGRQASQRGCLHRNRSIEADGGEQPHHSPVSPIHANGWTKTRGDATAVR